MRTKLLNPLGVSEGILIDCQNEIQRLQEELDVDVMTLRLLTSQTEAWEKEIQAEVVDECRSKIRRVIVDRSKMASRVVEELSFFEQWKIWMGRSNFDRAWESAYRRGQSITLPKSSTQNVFENELLSITGECSDVLISRAQSQGNASIEYLGKRPAIIGSGSNSRMVGNVSTPKFDRLKELQGSMSATIQNYTSNVPNDSQCADQVYSSLSRTALFSSMFVGSGVVPATFSFLGSLDATTAICGVAFSVLGGTMSLPLINQHVAASFEKEWLGNAVRLETAFEALFADTLQNMRSELSECISPYSRYVTSEVDLLNDLAEQKESGMSSAHSLRSKINKACK